MHRKAPSRLLSRLLLGGVMGSVAALCGCGQETEPRAQEASQDGSRAQGAADLLAKLRQQVVDGSSMNEREWGEGVEQLFSVLWPDREADGARLAATTHSVLSKVAGTMGRDVRLDPGGRAAWQERDPVSLEIHDAWLVATAAGPESYRAWCAGAGAALFKRLEDDRAKLFERPAR